LKEEALDRNLWRTRFGRGDGPVVRQTTKWINKWMHGKAYMKAEGVLNACALSSRISQPSPSHCSVITE
jgi:hypothetical protein